VKLSSSEENYLKTIFHLQLDRDNVTTNAVADSLQTRAASVTDMMKKLNAKKLLHYKPYYGFYLSAEGKKAAINIIRRHRLWEAFLVEKLGFGWDEVHLIAEELEHVSSKKLVDKLDEYLGFPQFDPHGDPIPDSKGKIASVASINLAALELHQVATVTSVTNQSKEMLDDLADKSITIGTRIEVKKRSLFDHSLQVKIKNKNITLTEQLARHLFVKKV
jgi:DtxR family transcriptional regulator, Mn-dependent transcriptional regulator